MSLSSLRFSPVPKSWPWALRPVPIAVDYPLLLTILLTAGLGMVVLYSAAGDPNGAMLRQGVRLGAGLIAFLTIAQIPPRYLRLWTPWIFIGVLGLLLVVMLAGEVGGGARRWLNLGFVSIQPS